MKQAVQIQDSDAYKLMEQISLYIFKLNGLLQDEAVKTIRDTKITNQRWRILGTVIRESHSITVPQIAREMGNARQGIQRAVDSMVQDGLLEYRSNRNHAKSKIVALTAEGKAVYASMMEKERALIEGLAKDIEIKKGRQAAAFLIEMINRLDPLENT
ncbi:MAG: MarR family transcriptional regulator [Spongiibacteraceae bacterium]